MLSYPTTHTPRQYKRVINKARKELYGSDLEAVYLLSIFANTVGVAGNFIKVKTLLINLKRTLILLSLINFVLLSSILILIRNLTK